MGVLDRFKKPKRTCEDPVFGHLESDAQSRWTGHVRFPPVGEEVTVVVATTGAEPGEEHRKAFQQLGDRYPSMLPAVSEALWELWEPYIKEWDAAASNIPRSAEDMLRAAQLEYVEVEGSGQFSLMYVFSEEVGWDDAMLCLSVRDWRISAEALND